MLKIRALRRALSSGLLFESRFESAAAVAALTLGLIAAASRGALAVAVAVALRSAFAGEIFAAPCLEQAVAKDYGLAKEAKARAECGKPGTAQKEEGLVLHF